MKIWVELDAKMGGSLEILPSQAKNGYICEKIPKFSVRWKKITTYRLKAQNLLELRQKLGLS